MLTRKAVCVVMTLQLCATGCTPNRPNVSVTAQLPTPLESRRIESAVRMVPGVSEVELTSNSPSYTLTGKRIPVYDTITFRAPGLSGALGCVVQHVDANDRTATTVRASATWYERPTAEEKRIASETLQDLMGWILLTARPDAARPDAARPHPEGETYRTR